MQAVVEPVDVHVYAERIVIRQDGVIVGERAPVRPASDGLRPLALRAGAGPQAGGTAQRRPFKDWMLPASLEKVRRKLAGSPDGDRQMVSILTGVLTDGLVAIDSYREALASGTASADVILNILARSQARRRQDLCRRRRACSSATPLADCAAMTTCAAAVSRSRLWSGMSSWRCWVRCSCRHAAAYDEIVPNGVKRQPPSSASSARSSRPR